jgi:hypothetical protein
MAVDELSQSQQPDRPALMKPRSEAADKIRKQIDRGKELIDKLILPGYPSFPSDEHQDIAKAECSKWSSHNIELLKRLFSDNSIATGYMQLDVLMLANASNDLRKRIEKNVAQLESILDRLDLIPESIQISQTEQNPPIHSSARTEKWYQSRAIQGSLIGAVALILVSVAGWFVTLYINKSNGNSSARAKDSVEVETIAPSPPPITSASGWTPLYARTKKRVDELEHMLITEKLMPWGLMQTGKPIEVTDYYGKTLHFEGIMFSGSPRSIFWGKFIEPFIENGIVEVLDAVAVDCRTNNLEPKPYLEEAAVLLDAMIRKVYDCMAETDQSLLGVDFQKRRNVSDKIEKMS